MKQKTIFIFINGIFASPGRKDGWTDLAVAHVKQNYPGNESEAYEYWATATRLGQREHAMIFMGIVNRAKNLGYRVVLVGHSNGCALIADVISKMGGKVDSVHLISPATRMSDFAYAIENKTVEQIYIYGSKADGVLKFGATFTRIITLGLKGYGSLGNQGPEFAAKYPEMVTDCSDDTFGHSTALRPGHLAATIKRIMDNEGLRRVKNPIQPNL